MRVAVLGYLEVRDDDFSPLALARRERVVLAALTWAGRRGLDVHELVDALWPAQTRPNDPEKVARNTVSRLRSRLGPNVVETTPAGYRLSASVVTDVAELDGLFQPNTPADVDWDHLLGLWRGRPYAELDNWPVAEAEVHRLEECRRQLEDEAAASDLRAGRVGAAISALESLVEREPLREHRWAVLIATLANSGRRVDALRAYQRARQTLAEVGVEPGRELVDAERTALQAVGAAEAPSESATTSGDQAPRPPDTFVGRSSELKALHEAWRRISNGAVEIWFVSGDAGIGKTALVTQFYDEVRNANAATSWVAISEDVAEPFAPLYAIFGARHATVDDKRGVTPLRHGTALDAADVDMSPDQWARAAQLAQSVASHIERLVSSDRLIVFDDVHWAAPSSLLALRYLIEQPELTHTMIVFVHRAAIDIATASAFNALRRRATSCPGGSQNLKGLTHTDAAHLAGTGVDNPDFEELWRATGGNPLLTTTLWSDTGDGTDATTSPTLRRMVDRELAPLDARARMFIEVAAITGESADITVVASACGLSDETLATTWDAVAGTSLMSTHAGNTVRFRHALVREMVLENLSLMRRAHLHGRVAQALEDSPAVTLVERARHALAAAVEAPDRGRAIELAGAAGRAALNQRAFPEAAQWFRDALSLHRAYDLTRYDLLVGLGRAEQMNRVADHRSSFIEAADIAASLNDTEREATALVGVSRVWGANDSSINDALISRLRRVRTTLGHRLPALRARMAAVESSERFWHPDVPARMAVARDAVELARSTNDRSTLCFAQLRCIPATWQPATSHQRLAALRELAATDDHTRTILDWVAIHIATCSTLVELGEFTAAAEALDSAYSLTAGLDEPFFDTLTRAPICQLLVAAGRLDEVRARVDAMRSDPTAEGFVLVVDATVLRLQHRWHELAARMRTSTPTSRTEAPLALAEAMTGDTNRAADFLQRHPCDQWHTTGHPMSRSMIWCDAARLATVVHHTEHAAALLTMIEPLSGRMETVAQAVCAEPVDVTLAALYHTIHRPADAATARAHATALATRATRALETWKAPPLPGVMPPPPQPSNGARVRNPAAPP